MRLLLLTGTCLAGVALPVPVCGQAAPVSTGQAAMSGQAGPSSADTAASSATTPQPAGVEDIVVTAQRRSERLQNVPVAVTAASATRLTAVGITNTQELAAITPGLIVPQTAGFVQPFIRGVGSATNGPGLEAPIATYIDGVYIASAPSALLTLNNVERIEVLKGPQGTLFGRNATGGLIQVVTKDPTSTPTLDLGLTYASYKDVTAEAYLSSGIVDNVSADLAVRYEHQDDGWGRNLATGNPTGDLPHDLAVRSKIVFDNKTGTVVKLAFDYEDRSSRREVQHVNTQYPATYDAALFGGPYDRGGRYDISNDFDPTYRLRAGGVSLTVRQDLSDRVAVQSITAFRQSWDNFTIDVDQTPVPYIKVDATPQDAQISQELQLSSVGDSRLKWVAGVYYYHAIDRWTPQQIAFGPTFISPIPDVPFTIDIRDRERTESLAGYAQASYEFLPQTNLTLGGRFTYEEKHESGAEYLSAAGAPISTINIPVPGTGNPTKLDFKRFNYRVALDHHFGSSILAYASYSTGFKSGGFNLNVPENPPYKPESIGAAEIGVKSELFQRRLRINTSAYRYNYSNIQVGRYIDNNESLYNGAKARIYGFDIDSELAVFSGLSLTGGVSYTHARFRSFPLADFIIPIGGCVPAPGGVCSGSAAGKRLPFAPTLTFNVGGNYVLATQVGKFVMNANYFRTSKYYSNPDNVGVQKAYGLLNASISWTDPSDRLSVRVFGKNLTKTLYATSLVEAGQGLIDALNAPRTFGVTLGYKY